LLAGSFLLKELSPLSAELGNLGAIGLEALDAINREQNPAPDQLQRWTAEIAAAEKPQANLLLMVAPSIQKLVNACTSAHASSGTARKK
jgi:hexosaminidase